MYKTELQVEAKRLQDQKTMQVIRAKAKSDIHELLRPWYSFRIYLKFKNIIFKRDGSKHDSNHFSGYEESCSYNQCLHGHVKEIFLNKEKGWAECIKMAEVSNNDRDGNPLYRYAQIYQRTDFPGGKFNILCRQYNSKGELEVQQDPVIMPADNKTLYFIKANIGLILTEEIAPADSDFTDLVNKALS